MCGGEATGHTVRPNGVLTNDELSTNEDSSVASDGTIGVTYYNLQKATTSLPGLTDAFIVHCHAAVDDCTAASSWSKGGQTRLSTTGLFDMTTAPRDLRCLPGRPSFDGGDPCWPGGSPIDGVGDV